MHRLEAIQDVGNLLEYFLNVVLLEDYWMIVFVYKEEAQHDPFWTPTRRNLGTLCSIWSHLGHPVGGTPGGLGA